MPGIVFGCNDDYLFNESDTAEMRGVASGQQLRQLEW